MWNTLKKLQCGILYFKEIFAVQNTLFKKGEFLQCKVL